MPCVTKKKDWSAVEFRQGVWGGSVRAENQDGEAARAGSEGENRQQVDSNQSIGVLGYWLQIRQSPSTGLC